MRLRNRKSQLNVLPEGMPTRRSAMTWVRLLYFGMLIAILGYVMIYALGRLWYVEARGHVTMARHLLQTDREGVLRGLTLRVGDAVTRGQPLFRVEQEVVEDRRNQALWEIIKGEREIRLRRAELAVLEREIAEKEARIKSLTQLKLLELDRQSERLETALIRDLEADRARAAVMKASIEALQGYLSGVRAQGIYHRQVSAETYTSPFDGFVYRVEKGEHEFAHRGETVLVLEDARAVKVVAYFPLEDLQRLRVGRRLEVLLPDGLTHPGEIERVDSAALDYRERLARGYEPLESLVRVQIRPVGQAAGMDWRRYNQLDVKVRFRAWDIDGAGKEDGS